MFLNASLGFKSSAPILNKSAGALMRRDTSASAHAPTDGTGSCSVLSAREAQAGCNGTIIYVLGASKAAAPLKQSAWDMHPSLLCFP